MPVRVSNLRVEIGEPESALPDRLAKLLGVTQLPAWRVLRKSLDLRDKADIHFVYNAAVDLSDARKRRADGAVIEPFADEAFTLPPSGAEPLRERPVVVGSGPAGLAAAYFLAERGYRPLVLERGTKVSQRIRDVAKFDEGGAFEPESNYLFGEGGAGTFSDGKLTCRGTGPDVQRVLQLFADCKGKPSILYEHRPHLGSNRLPAVVKAMRQRIESLGGEVRFLCRVEDLLFADGRLQGLGTSSGFIPAEVVVLAPGHSARDTYEMLLRRGVPLARKAFQMGVRVEHPQELVNRVQYGRNDLKDQLGNADYSLVASGDVDLFTFCMCAGGYVIPSVSQVGYFCTNGMSLSKRDAPTANSGLVVTVPPELFGPGDVLAGVRLQAEYERKAFELSRDAYRCPAQRASDFVAGRVTPGEVPSSYPRGTVSVALDEVLPPFVAQAVRAGLPKLDRKWQGRFLKEATLVGPEARGSSPIRIIRDDESREAPGISGLYPVGEGAGYAGGIVSAAVDGLRTARAIIARFASIDRRLG